MKFIYHLIRLTRPVNLVVIALTMMVFHLFLLKYQGEGERHYDDYSVYHDASATHQPVPGQLNIDFILLVISTVLIAAAGNIINDYFDLKADRVNKPQQLIIDVHIKRRVAILWNWILNSIGFLIAFYLSYKLSNWWIVFISFVSINTLWFYSMYFKRTFLVGNVFVALLTGIVPIYVLILYLPLEPVVIMGHEFLAIIDAGFLVLPIVAISAVAFSINLIREVVKDIADVKGDLLLKAQTIPIRWGIRKAKWTLFFLLLPLLFSLFLYISFCWELDFSLNGGSRGFEGHNPPLINAGNHLYFAICSVLVLLSVVAAYVILVISNQRKYYLLSANLLKVAMLFGLLTPLFL